MITMTPQTSAIRLVQASHSAELGASPASPAARIGAVAESAPTTSSLDDPSRANTIVGRSPCRDRSRSASPRSRYNPYLREGDRGQRQAREYVDGHPRRPIPAYPRGQYRCITDTIAARLRPVGSPLELPK